jgi:hypothetical protein
MWRAGFGSGFGPVGRQTAKWMNEWMISCWTVLPLQDLRFSQWYCWRFKSSGMWHLSNNTALHARRPESSLFLILCFFV